MTDPNRLLDGSESSHTRALLRAGMAETAPDGFSERLMAGVAGAAATSALTSAAAAAQATGAKLGGAVAGAAGSSGAAPSLALVAAKWVAVGVLGGGILAASAELSLSPRLEPSRAPAAVDDANAPAAAPRGPGNAARVTAPPPPVAASNPPAVDATSQRAASPATAPSSARSSQLGREVESIDRVRRALAAGNTSLALSELDTYARLSSTGVLDREARVLRIQALRDAGDVAGAQRLTERYLADFPNDAHAVRMRTPDPRPGTRTP